MAWMGGGRGGCERHGILENSSTVMENRLWGPLCWIRFKLKKNFKAFPFMLTLAYKSYHCGFMPSCLMTWAARQEGTPSFTLVTLSHAAAVCLGLPCPQGVSSCRMSVLGWSFLILPVFFFFSLSFYLLAMSHSIWEAFRILVAWPGIKPATLAVEVQSLNLWTTRGVPCLTLLSPTF